MNKTCEWRQEDHGADFWQTDCGEAFVFITDGPQENGMKYCCYCGKSLVPIKHEEVTA